jgi:glycosyltransferase involved in cell wall biosynthesis
MTPFECSLLIPCRNAARFLPALFQCAVAQHRRFAEIILWDDGSTDDSARIARTFGASVLGSPVSRGPSQARNALVQAASCEWVHLHDADDIMSPAFLSTLSAYARHGIDIVACDADWVDEQTRSTVIAWRYRHEDYSPNPSTYLLSHPLGINNCLYRRDTFIAEGGYDSSLMWWEDADFHFRLAVANRRFAFVPEVLTWSIRHPGGISMDYVRNWRSRLHCLHTYADKMPTYLYPAIAAEAETAARALLGYGELTAARDAVRLAVRLGGNPPTSNNALIRLLRRFVSPYLLLRWQSGHRRHAD